MLPVESLRRNLLEWYDRNRRDLPWRANTDPYRVWLSEVMLQQTRVSAAIPYFEKFLQLFPDVRALAAARPQAVLRAWAGLGYYSRARAAHAAAREVARRGHFPDSYDALLELPGIGPYTAAAIASIAFGEPRAALDGNARRVLSRLLARASGLEEASALLLDRDRPGEFNQAMMELGSTVCLPREPRCAACPLAGHCSARRQGVVHLFPPPKAKRPVVEIALRLAVVLHREAVLMVRPSGAGLWPRFWTLPQLPLAGIRRGARMGEFRHAVTFRRIRVEVFRGRLQSGNAAAPETMRFLSAAELARLPVSTPSRKALRLLDS